MTTPPAGGPSRRGRFDRLPAPVVFVVVLIAYLAIGIGLRALDHHGLDLTYVIGRVVVAVVLAGLTTFRLVRSHRALGGASGIAAMRTALEACR